MGILENNNSTYLSVSCGKLINKNKSISTFGVEGIIQDIYEKSDEYEGKEIKKVCVKLTDGKESFIVQFSAESFYSSGFFERIKNADLSKSIIIGVSGSEKNEKVSFCWLKHSGTSKGVTIQKDPNFVQPKKVTFKGKDFWDFTDLLTEIPNSIKWVKDNLPTETSNIHYVKDMTHEPTEEMNNFVAEHEKTDPKLNKVETPDDELPF